MRVAAMLFILLALSGCSSGTWEDDAANWKRALGINLPEGIELVHSHYWRSAHWTMEYAYFFVLKDSPAAREMVFKWDEMKRYENADELRIPVDGFFNDKPTWFVPKKLEQYEIWIIKDPAGRGNFRLFIDKETKEMHITDYQV